MREVAPWYLAEPGREEPWPLKLQWLHLSSSLAAAGLVMCISFPAHCHAQLPASTPLGALDTLFYDLSVGRLGDQDSPAQSPSLTPVSN